MVGFDVAAGYLFMWLASKVGRAGRRANDQADRAIDAGVDRAGEKLYELVAGKVPEGQALERLELEAAEGRTEPSQDALTWMKMEIENAARKDPEFAESLQSLIAELQKQQPATGQTAFNGGVAFSGSPIINARDGAVINVGGRQVVNPFLPGTPRK